MEICRPRIFLGSWSSFDKTRHQLIFVGFLVTVSTISTSSTPSSHSYMKHASLISLTLQNAVSILLLRYVRTLPGPRFINSTAVFSSEIVKTIASVLLLLREEGSVKKGLRLIYEKIKYHPKDTLKTGIPALLYTLQNNLLFIAISNLDAATFQVCHLRTSCVFIRLIWWLNTTPFFTLGELSAEDFHYRYVHGPNTEPSTESLAMARIVSAFSRCFFGTNRKYDLDRSQTGRQPCLRNGRCRQCL